MKKALILIVLCLVAMGGRAERLYEPNRFGDNWSLGFMGGVQSNLYSFNVPQGAVGGLSLNKQVTPAFGLTFEGWANVNGNGNWQHPKQGHFHGRWDNWVDGAAAFVVGRVNLMNWMGRYKGRPRVFEIEMLGGVGYGHIFSTHQQQEDPWGFQNFMTKAGMNINFNMGSQRVVTFALKPAVVWYATGPGRLDCRRAVAELTAGLQFHLPCHNGTHHHAFGRAYDQTEVDALNATISDLRSVIADRDEDMAVNLENLAEALVLADSLQAELDACREAKPQVKTVTRTQTVVKNNNLPDVLVTFRQGKTIVDPSQMPNVERVATYLKSHPKAKVSIVGFASPEGSREINERIAKQRAEAVKTTLMSRYGIAAGRITAEGQGIGDMFSEPDWNRVSICTIGE